MRLHPSRLPHLVQLIGNAFESALLQPKELKNAISDNAHLQGREKKKTELEGIACAQKCESYRVLYHCLHSSQTTQFIHSFQKKIFMQTPTCCQGANEESCGLKEHSWIILPVRLDTFTAPCAFACWASYGEWGGGTPWLSTVRRRGNPDPGALSQDHKIKVQSGGPP